MAQKIQKDSATAVARVGLANFLQRYRSVLIVGIILILVLLAGFATWSIWTQSVKVKYANKVEQIETSYNNWKQETDATKKQKLAQTLVSELTAVEKSAPNSYGLLKTYYIQGEYLETQKKYAEASAIFHKVFELNSSNYLAPVSLLNAAVCLENSGNEVQAEAFYVMFQKKFPQDKILGPQVGFSLGRIYESQNKPLLAIASYKKVVDNFTESDWAKLARDRLFLLQPAK
jgi:tetratricopeptide (TPR) repeat protein